MPAVFEISSNNFARREIAGNGTRVAFTHPDLRRVRMAYLNGQALGADRVTFDGNTATFSAPPQSGDTVLLLGTL